MHYYITEDQIERAGIDVCVNNLHYDHHFNCQNVDHLKRVTENEVIYKDALYRNVRRINCKLTDIPGGISNDEIDSIMRKVTEIDSVSNHVQLNQEMMQKITNGVSVMIRQKDGHKVKQTAHFIDWENPEKNEFDVVNQLWIQGTQRLRPDVILFINGLPLVTFELKDGNIDIKNAYTDNLTRYKKHIPQLMAYNVFLVASNGVQTRIGATYAPWDFFFPWLRVKDEKEKIDHERIESFGCSLDYLLLGLFPKEKLLDYIRNFILFHKGNKICAKNHQFIGVNHAVDRFKAINDKSYDSLRSPKAIVESGSIERSDKGKLGVFWHTQGSGKSFSMVFFARKIVREFSGNYTFLIITDREDLDRQIYRTFLNCGFMSATDDCRPKNSEKLRKMLTQNKKIIFTLIQKFRYGKGLDYPLLSERDDIIVIIDEAHRTQYKDLAQNLRAGLPNAQYMAFTGTPLFGSKRLTNLWFGDIVSEYNFMQAIEDDATVPLTYRNRLPEMQNQNPTFSDDFAEIISNENLTDAECEKLEKEHATEYEVLKRPSRLQEIAHDIVLHFTNRGYLGKGMVVSVDKITAVRMYEYVSAEWQKEIQNLNKELMSLKSDQERFEKKRKLRDWMKETDMAVVISEVSNDDMAKFQNEGLDISKHMERLNAVDDEGQELEDLFKNPSNPLRLVFVCSMWLTGFDAPTVSTLYLDKPIVGHNLMQTIARANRKTDELDIYDRPKKFGQLIAYCNVFGKLKAAFAQYGGSVLGDPAGGEGGGEGTEGSPAISLDELYEKLKESIQMCMDWCKEQGVDLTEITALGRKKTFNKIDSFAKFANILVVPEERRVKLRVFDNTITAIYDECLPDIIERKKEFEMAEVIHYLRQVMDNNIDKGNLANARLRIGSLLDESLLPRPNQMVADDSYIIRESKEYDLSKLDIEKLKKQYQEREYKNLEIQDLAKFIEKKLEQMTKENQGRESFLVQMQKILDKYNAGSAESEAVLDELFNLMKEMSEEEQRAAREGLTEQELEIFDLLRKGRELTKNEEIQVKTGARDLLKKLKEGHDKYCPVDWHKDTAKKTSFYLFLNGELDSFLPDSYDRMVFTQKLQELNQLFLSKAERGQAFV